ncbi:MAG: class II glutamine amidotransferase [Anaerolineae bacterium]|nr:class II glutamine amidotransferase [Anaerolineae bacterium]
MCGLFGFIGTRLDIGLVNALAGLAETRGPHAYGFAWLEGDRRMRGFKSPGRITERRADLLKLLDATAFIGHCRLSTSGAPADNRNNQPLLMSDGESALALAHNGNVYASRQIYDLHGYVPKTANDSEALLLAAFCAFGTLPERAAQGWAAIGKAKAQAALLLSIEGIAAFRAYHHLYVKSTTTGIYLCSRPLDNTMALLPEGFVHHFQNSDQDS